MASGIRPAAVSAAFAAAVAFVAATTARAEAPFDFAKTPGQLPKTVVPSAYRIVLRPDLSSLTLTASETIAIDVSAPARTIVLDSSGLTFRRVRLDGASGSAPPVTLNTVLRTATLHFTKAIAPGRHQLTIDYSGPIPAQPAGIYYDDYPTPSGTKRMLVTQFEDIYARQMFPGFDEPAFKATFQLTVTLPRGLTVLSNTPIANDRVAGAGAHGEALHTVTFEQTPRMSSYLVVLVAGDLRSVTSSAAGTRVAVWAPSGREPEGTAALADESALLPYYNDYFGVRYPLPKLDLIAIPGNFAAGAMENWGGITFIDSSLLFAPQDSSTATRELVFGDIAHEMAHQWSGDLVTMAWWNDIWLNEGFASWMATKATDHFNPSWNEWLRARDDTETAMALDAKRTTHPIQQPIATEADIGQAFDLIAYLKGQAFLRMIETYLGEDTFRDGMRRYMRKHAYSNTTSADLWAALEAASGKPVASIAAGFTQQPGVPLVHVATSCSGGQTSLTLTQSRFTIDDPKAKPQTWQIPVRLASFAGTATPAQTMNVLLGGAPASVRFAGCGQPISANFGDTGYYRVAYDDAELHALRAGYASLPASERVALVADQWALFEGGLAPIASYLDFVNGLGTESSYAVWKRVIGSLIEMDDAARTDAQHAALRTYARGVLDPAFTRVGWDARAGEGENDPLLRADLISALGRFGDPAVVAEARRRFTAFASDPRSLDPDLRTAVADAVGWNADRATFDALRARGRAATTTEARLRYYYALAGARDPALIDAAVQIALTDELPNGRVNRFLRTAASRDGDPRRVYAGVVANYAAFARKLSSGQLSGLLPSIVQASSDPALAAELEALPAVRDDPAARYEARLAAQAVANRARLGDALAPQYAAWAAAPAAPANR